MSKSKKIITVILTILMLTVFFIIYVLVATIAPRSGKSGLIFSMLLYVICGIILEMAWIIKAILAGRKKKNPLNTCDTNPNCEYDPETCGFAIEYSTFEDVSNGIHRYMCGRDKCKYQK